MRKSFLTILMALPVMLPCMAGNADDRLEVSFEGRQIDIAPYFRDLPPYAIFYLSSDARHLLFQKTGKESRMLMLDLAKSKDIREAEEVVNLDFSTRNCWSPTYNPADGYVYWEGDESNDEIINFYRTRPGTNEVQKLTDVPYIYASGFNPAHSKIAYVPRLAQNEARLDQLRVLDLCTLEDKLICEDNPTFRFTWGEVCWQPEEKGFVLLALKGIDRTYTNVVYVDAATGKISPITDTTCTGGLSNTRVLSEWATPDRCIFISDQDGWSNLYAFDLGTGKTTRLTSSKIGITGAKYVRMGNKRCLLAAESNPIGTVLTLLDPVDGKVIWKESRSLSISLLESKDGVAYASAGSAVEYYQLLKLTATKKGLKEELIMDAVPADVKKQIVHSNVERLSIPTFDIDPATGKQRLIHAYLYVPENPLPKDRQVVLLESFYGGGNRYSEEIQIYCQAGVYVLSPSPRGSDGFGRDFEALNDKDLGGNEIIDIICCAKYISDSLGIPPSRVGCFGMSHGGYATMRLMTFPGQVNGHKAFFPFGFGMESAGFADIIWDHYNSNIPDWTALEAGDPSNPLEWYRIQGRSPLNNAEHISGPLLMMHGTHDNRVNPWGSTFMAMKLKELGKPYKYVEFEGMGHGFKGTEANRKFYQTEFSFIEDFVLNK